MKGSDGFKTTINNHLQSLAEKDPLFAETLKKPKKNIDDCVTYIMNTVKASGKNGFSDDEVYGMAVHYYDEDDLKPGAKVSGTVVVNHKVELTPEELAEAENSARAEAKEKARKTALARLEVEEQKNVKLSEEDIQIAKEKARSEAIQEAEADLKAKLTKKVVKKQNAVPVADSQPSLF
jgi:hypothetical protein